MTGIEARERRRRYAGALSLGLAALAFAWDLAGGSVFALPADGSTVIGEDSAVTTVYEDTLPDLAQRYSLGYYEIIRAISGTTRSSVQMPGWMFGSRGPTNTSRSLGGASCRPGRAMASW